MRGSSRRSLRRSSRTPREQFIALAGVAAGGPFLLLGFLLLDFPLLVFLLLGLPERSGFATLQQAGIFRPKQSGWASQDGRDLPRCRGVAFSDRFSAECRLKVVEICHAATGWHFATKTIGIGLPGWSGFVTLLQPGVSRPFLSRKPSENGRDLPRYDSQANPDRFPRRTPCPPLDAPPPAGRPLDAPPPAGRPAPPACPASRRLLPIGKSAQIETFVATRDAQLFR